MHDPELMVSALREKELQAEVFDTGGGIRLPAVILERDQEGWANRYVLLDVEDGVWRAGFYSEMAGLDADEGVIAFSDFKEEAEPQQVADWIHGLLDRVHAVQTIQA